MNTDYSTYLTTFYANAGDTILSEYVEYTYLQPTWTKSYTYFGDTLLSTISNASGAEYIEFNHPDQLGTRTITNQQAGTSYEQKTLPFGTALNAESTVQTNNKRFTSYDRSNVTGLDYAVNRTYDSKQGRFTQVDPIGMSASSLSNPQTLNLYTYCGNDPINHTDPSGLFWGFFKKLFKWVLIAIAVIVAIVTIVTAPVTIAGILGAISAGAGAASAVLGGLGFQKAAMILGLIAIGTGFGSIIAARQGKGLILQLAERTERSHTDFLAKYGILTGVGAVANFAQQDNKSKKRKKKESDVDIMINQAVMGALSRLTDPDCANYIAGTSGLDARQTLLDLQKAKKIKFKNMAGIGHSSVGGGSKGNIDLGYEFFRVKNPGGYVGDPRLPDADQVRQLAILHELRHDVSGIGHPLDANGNEIHNVPESNEDFNKNILDKCF